MDRQQVVEPRIPKRKPRFCDQHTVNRLVAKIIPVLLVGAAGFATWVYIAQICVNWLMKRHGNTGLAAGLITIYLILFGLMTSCFFRLLFAGPGYIPRPKDDREKSIAGSPDPTVTADMFVCEQGGYPRWCRTCEVIKPDRAHHSSDSGRCTYRMDHFCPWVGGMVGWSRYKFFLQFVSYTALFCSFVLGSVAPFTKQHIEEEGGQTFPTTWIIVIVLAGFFALFMIPFSITHTYYTLHNITTNESFDHKYRTYLFNVLVLADQPKPEATPTSSQSVATSNYSSSARVVVTTDPGDNPWDVGWRRNWTQIMGDKVWDWFLPIRPSQGDGARFPYNEALVKKLQARARAIIAGQSLEAVQSRTDQDTNNQIDLARGTQV